MTYLNIYYNILEYFHKSNRKTLSNKCSLFSLPNHIITKKGNMHSDTLKSNNKSSISV